jgi:hypothetical protein
MKRILISIIVTITVVTGFAISVCAKKISAYKNAKLPVEQRVDNRISLMSIEEKIEQTAKSVDVLIVYLRFK